MNSMLTVLLKNRICQIENLMSSPISSCACYLSSSYFMTKHLVLRAILPANKTREDNYPALLPAWMSISPLSF